MMSMHPRRSNILSQTHFLNLTPDTLNQPSDDEDEHANVLDVWSGDKADALEVYPRVHV
jgi:hypothetical protein